MFLSREELTQLTGFKRRSPQINWLTQNGYTFDVRADGWPVVLIEQLQVRQVSQKRLHRATEPDLAALDDVQ